MPPTGGSEAVPLRARAVAANEKLLRRESILDAAEQLWTATPGRTLHMADVAAQAGLAKGTVYLYFPSKEELLLAMHHRHVGTLFDALIMHLDSNEPASIESVLAITRTHMFAHPSYLTCATVCLGTMESALAEEALALHFQFVSERLSTAGALVERRFAPLPPGEGMRLLHHSYALVLGMWRLSRPDAPGSKIFNLHFLTEAEAALRTFWAGRLAQMNETQTNKTK